MYSRLIDITRKLKLAAIINKSDHVGSIRNTHKTNSTQEAAREVCQQLNSMAQTTPAKRIHISHHPSRPPAGLHERRDKSVRPARKTNVPDSVGGQLCGGL